MFSLISCYDLKARRKVTVVTHLKGRRVRTSVSQYVGPSGSWGGTGLLAL